MSPIAAVLHCKVQDGKVQLQLQRMKLPRRLQGLRQCTPSTCVSICTCGKENLASCVPAWMMTWWEAKTHLPVCSIRMGYCTPAR